jgi:tetratricopeptide (TPR) repeat protein
MLQSHKISFYFTTALIFLLPIFFIPGGVLALGMSKAALLIIGIALASLIFAFEAWSNGRVIIAKHYFLIAAALLPVVYFLSAILATPSSLSLFGYGFEAGTFGYMLLGVALFALISMVFIDTKRTLAALSAFFLSIFILAIFIAAQVLFGPSMLFGASNMGNPLGSWTDLAVAFGLLAVFSSLTLGMLPANGLIRIMLYAAFFVSTALLAIMNFQTALIFTLIASVALFFYFRSDESASRGALILPILLGIISLVFLVNPVVTPSGAQLDVVISESLGVNNADVRPSFTATLGISKAVLSQTALLGSGPNTFGQDWLIYRPTNINFTPFWGAVFPFGAGFLPTQIASTGILGSAVWLAFFILLITLAVRALSLLPESRGERFAVITTLFASLFLWGVNFLYAPSDAMLMLSFIFSGLFVGSLVHSAAVNSSIVEFRKSTQTKLAVLLIILAVTVGSLAISWAGWNRVVSAYYFNNAVRLSNTEGASFGDIENEIIKAISYSPSDVYFVALSRLNFSRAQIVAQSEEGTEEDRQAVFEDSIRRSVEAGRLAVSANPAGYENWVALGTIYSVLVPKPLEVEGAYENAIYAFQEASRRNPSNPELPLLVAQLELNRGETDRARSYIRNSIALKEDYADAYFMLAQLEVSAGNTKAAIASAENLAILLPQNAGVHFELGILKHSAGNFEGALESLNRALTLAPDFANAKYYLGVVLAELGRFSEAEAQFAALAQTNPDSPEVAVALEAVRANRVPETLGNNAQAQQ